MAGYTRQSAASIANGQIIEDYHFNNEFNQLEAAFSGVTGHAHDGSEGNGPKINLTTSVDGVLPVANGGTGVTTLQGLNDALTSGSIFKDGSFVIGDSADTTKRFRFEVSSVSSATTRVFTLPNADVTISSYMGGLLSTANKADLQAALDIDDAFDMDNMVEGTTNKILTAAERSDIAANTSARHTHSNKAVLDATEQAFTTALKSKLDSIEAGAQVNPGNATTSAAGLMSASDKQKLDGIAAGANVTNATTVGSAIHGSSAKATPVDADTVALIDSAASNTLKKLSWSNIKATLKTYFDTLYAAGDDSRITGAVQRSGDTMTGALTLSGDPTNNLHAATKQYVDTNAVKKAGDTGLGGFVSSTYDLGNSSGKTIKPNPANGNYQTLTNNGNFTLQAPDDINWSSYSILIRISGSGGTCTATGFTKVYGQLRTSGNNFATIRVINTTKVLVFEEAN